MLALARRTIDVGAVERTVAAAGCGALVTFVGIVRGRSDDGHPVDGLSYEAYEPMALQEFERIAREARERYGATSAAIVHRVGDVAVGEVAVVVAIGAEHRAQAFDACSYAIEELKARAPIWKQERYRGGAPSRWRSNEIPAATQPSQ
jgi:molybdopterin synthase catalytic subunit